MKLTLRKSSLPHQTVTPSMCAQRPRSLLKVKKQGRSLPLRSSPPSQSPSSVSWLLPSAPATGQSSSASSLIRCPASFPALRNHQLRRHLHLSQTPHRLLLRNLSPRRPLHHPLLSRLLLQLRSRPRLSGTTPTAATCGTPSAARFTVAIRATAPASIATATASVAKSARGKTSFFNKPCNQGFQALVTRLFLAYVPQDRRTRSLCAQNSSRPA